MINNEAVQCSVDNPKTVIVIAPFWLRDALNILLQAYEDSDATDQPSQLLLFSPPRGREAQSKPAYPKGGEAHSVEEAAIVAEVRRIKQSWPTARLLVLVDDTKTEDAVREAGAQVVLLTGVSAQRLLNEIKGLLIPYHH